MNRLAQLEAIWSQSPWGMAVIDDAGDVSAANPALLRSLALNSSELGGLSEASLVALIGNRDLEHHRSATCLPGLKAIHYTRKPDVDTSSIKRLSKIAELLREPLAGASGFAELLATQRYDEETRRDLTITLLAEIETLSGIINLHLDLNQ